MYTYSKHIKIRMEERNITLSVIEMLIRSLVDTVRSESKKDESVLKVMGFVGLKGYVVFLNKETNILITTRRMRKKEERFFMEVKRNG